MTTIISQPMLMIDKNMQNSAIKIHATYQYKNDGVHTADTSITIYGIDKNGKTPIAVCPLNTISGYTAMEIASSLVVGIPVQDYAYICYEYTPSANFAKIVNGANGQPGIQMFAEQRAYPDSVDLANKHTLAV